MNLNHSRFLIVLLATLFMSTAAYAGKGKDLRHAAHVGDIDTVKRVLDEGVNPDAAGKSGGTALIKAAKEGHTAIVQLLLFYGADPTLKNNKGHNAIEVADGNNHNHIASILRDARSEQSVTVHVGSVNSETFSSLMTSALLGRRWQIETSEANNITAVYFRSDRAYKVAASLSGDDIVIHFIKGYGSIKMNYLYNLRSDLQHRL